MSKDEYIISKCSYPNENLYVIFKCSYGAWSLNCSTVYRIRFRYNTPLQNNGFRFLILM